MKETSTENCSAQALPFKDQQSQTPGSQTASSAVPAEHSTALRRGTPITEHATNGNLVQPTPYQIVIRSDPKQLPEITKGHWSVGFEPKVIVVMSRGQVAPFTDQGQKGIQVFAFVRFLKRLPKKQPPTGWLPLTHSRAKKHPPRMDTRMHAQQQACSCSQEQRCSHLGKSWTSSETGGHRQVSELVHKQHMVQLCSGDLCSLLKSTARVWCHFLTCKQG